MAKITNVLSLFDGLSCGQIALKELGINVNNYYAAEIDKFAVEQTQHNFPNTIQLGDVTKVKIKDLERIDLLIGGSPCQGFSFAGLQLNFDDPRSALFFEFVRLWKEIKAVNPNAKFMLENVNMKDEYLRVISEYMGVFPVRINSNLVSAQNRDRYYWTNIQVKEVGLFGELYSDIPQPEDRGILLKDILQDESEVDGKYTITNPKMESFITDEWRLNKKYTQINGAKAITQTARQYASWGGDFVCVAMRGRGEDNTQQLEPKSDGKTNCLTSVAKDNLVMTKNYIQFDVSGKGYKSQQDRAYYEDGKHGALATSRADTKNGVAIYQKPRGFNKGGVKEGKSPPITSSSWENNNHVIENFKLRRLTPTECARLQTIPEWYEWIVSDSQAYKMLGNGWTVEVIKHIFSFL